MLNFATLGDLLKRRYVSGYVEQAQNLSMPIYSMLRTDSNYTPSGDGAFFAVNIQGNEVGGGWRGTDDNSLPAAGNEQVKQFRVRPKKFYHVIQFSGLAQAVSARGGEDAFVAGVTHAIDMGVKRSGLNFVRTFPGGDGTGRLTNINGTQSSATSLNVDDARPFRRGMSVEFINNSTGIKAAGPVTVTDYSIANATITVNSAVSVTDDDGIYITGEQSGAAPPSEVTALGLPAMVNNTGTLYQLSRTTYPILQSKVIAASSTSLDESLLRRLQKQILVESNAGSVDNYGLITNYDQFDRYVEIALPFRRHNDMQLNLGAMRDQTKWGSMGFMTSHQALADELFMMNLDVVVRGVVRPFSIDDKVNAQWVPGTDSFTILLKAYCENIIREANTCGRLTGLTVPTY